PFRLPGVTFFCISDTLVPTTYLVDTTLSNSSDSDQTVQAVRLLLLTSGEFRRGSLAEITGVKIAI
ncbi:hypothetical protein, partial [Escherichia coli]|uniref:hypothetical protein n=2 Tax=Escherichia coli TaxID=562 RepID=UPI001A96E8FD